MPTTSTIVSRLLLDHPDLGYDPGPGLHTAIRTLYTKVGDMINSRFFIQNGLANGANVDFEHNFKCAFDELRYILYLRNTGTGELTRIDSASTPAISDFAFVATPSFTTTKIRVTNNSGASRDIALVVVQGKGAEVLDDLEDVNLGTPPEDGQALVFDAATSKWIPGASGDSSFKVQSVAADGTTVIKGGPGLIDNEGRVFKTYDGTGGASTDYGNDLTIDLDALISSPTNDTTYYLYIDEGTLGAAVTLSDTGEKVYGIVQGNFALLSSASDVANLTRYTPIGFVRRATGAWSTSIFGTLATRRHDDPAVAVSPVVYSLSKQTVGAVGDSSQIRAGHILDADSMPANISAANQSFYNLNDVNDDSTNARTLTNSGSVTFAGADIHNTARIAVFGGANNLESSSSFFDRGSNPLVVGGWFRANDWSSGTHRSILNAGATGTNDRSWDVGISSAGDIEVGISSSGTGVDDSLVYTPPVAFADGSWHHIAFSHDTFVLKIYVDGVLVAQKTTAVTIRNMTTDLFRIGTGFGSGFIGRAQDVFFIAGSVLDSDIKKLASTRISHNKNVPVANQLWSFNHYDSVSGMASPLGSAILDLKVNAAYVDFIDASTADSIEGKLQDMGMTARTVSVQTFDRTFTSDPAIDVTPIPTYLQDDPTSFEVLKYVDGKWSPIPDGNSLIEVASTGNRNLSGDLSSTSPSILEPVRVIISCAPAATAVSVAKVAVKGIIEAQWTGYTRFVGGTHPDAYSTLTAALAASSAGDSILVMSDYSISADETISVADVKIEFMPGVKITIGSGVTDALVVNAARISLLGIRYLANFAGTLNSFMRFSSNARDCNVSRAYLEANNAGLTVTNAVDFDASSARNAVYASKLATAGAISAAFVDAGTDNDPVIRG